MNAGPLAGDEQKDAQTMPAYEVLTRISNGKKKPHVPGAVLELDADAALPLVAVNALRPVAMMATANGTEAAGEPIGTAQRAMAAATAGQNIGFLTTAAQLRTELDALTVKDLDQLIEDEKVELEGSHNKAAKVAAIADARAARMLGTMDRAQLLDLAAASGYADIAALELSVDAADDEVRAALMRVAAAKAD